MLRGFPSHVDLTVSDLSRSIAFYAKVLEGLGFRRYEGDPDGAPCWAVWDGDGGAFSIALHEARGEGAGREHDRYSPGLHHLAFHADSREDVDRFHDFLLDLGVEILDPPAEYEYTAGYYAVFFADPDGLKLELVFEPAMRGNVESP